MALSAGVAVLAAALLAVAFQFFEREEGEVMRSSAGIGAVGAFLAFVAVATGAEARPPEAAGVRAPLGFEPNRGQAPGEVEFLARGRSYVLTLSRGDAVLTVGGATVRMRTVGANPAPAVLPRAPLPGRVHYLTGGDAARWRTGIPTYARVLYRDVYPAIDLVYHGSQGQLEYDFVVAPGADPAVIRLAFDGADELALDDDGALRLTTPAGALRLPPPTLYQERDGARQAVAGGFVVQGTTVAFWTGTYDRGRPLVIDPVLEWSSYLGGSFFDGATAIAVDAAGDVYVTGWTQGGTHNPPVPPGPSIFNDFPTTPGAVQPVQPTCGSFPFSACGDVFVAKLAGDGSGLLWATYLGGSGGDAGRGIAVDATGQVHVSGDAQSTDFPTTPGAPFPAHGPGVGCGHSGCPAGFIAKLSADGSALVYASYLGGSSASGKAGAAIAVDDAGNAYVTGHYSPPAAPTQHHFGVFAGSYSAGAFVLKFDPAGALVYSADFGVGNGTGIAVDAAGHAYITGIAGPDFPIVRALQPSLGGGGIDAFVAKLTPDGSALVYSTYLGGSASDLGAAIALDAAGQVYVAGSTSSADFPTTPGALTAGAVGGAFVTKLDANGTGLVYSAVIADGQSAALAVDASGSAYVAGAAGPGFPTVDPVQAGAAGGGDAFVAKLSPSGSALVYATYLGGSGPDSAGGIALGAPGTAYVTGGTESANFPTVEPFQTGLRGASDAFVVKLVESASPPTLPPLAFEVRPTTVVLNPIAPGDTQSIETHVWASAAAGGILVDLEVYSAGGVKVAQQVHGGQSFAAGQTRVYRWNLPLGATFPAGTYTVKIGIFTGDWSHLYVWVNQAATFVVDPAIAVLRFTVGAATVTPDRVDPGRSVSVVAPLTASRPVPLGAVTVVLEVYSPSGQRVAQDAETMSFGTGSPQFAHVLWDVPAAASTGRYAVAVSVFNADGSLVYVQTAQAGTFVVGTAPPPPPGPLAFTVSPAVVTPNPAAPGEDLDIDVEVTATATVSGILVDVELYDAGGAKRLQAVFGAQSFIAAEPRLFPWTIGAGNLAPGTYTVKVGIFSADWSTLHAWVSQAGTVSVGRETPPPGPLTFTIGTAAVTPNPVSAGQTVRLDVAVSASAAASAILVDLELYDAAGAKVAQSVATGQSFAAGQTRTYPWTIGPVSLPAGTYTVRAGIFSADWSTLHTWDGDAGTLTVR
jgi:hypothetical protein